MQNEESHMDVSLRKLVKGAGFVLAGTLFGRVFRYGPRPVIAQLGASEHEFVSRTNIPVENYYHQTNPEPDAEVHMTGHGVSALLLFRENGLLRQWNSGDTSTRHVDTPEL